MLPIFLSPNKSQKVLTHLFFPIHHLPSPLFIAFTYALMPWLFKKMKNQYSSSPAHESSCVQVHSILRWSYPNFWGVKTQSTPTVEVQPYSNWRWRRCNYGTPGSTGRLRGGQSWHHQRHSAQGPWIMCPSFSAWKISQRFILVQLRCMERALHLWMSLMMTNMWLWERITCIIHGPLTLNGNFLGFCYAHHSA